MTTFVGLVLSASLSVGCGSSPTTAVREPEPRGEWHATRPGADDLTVAREACIAEATRQSAGVRTESFGTKAGLASFIRCMRARGWEMQPTSAGR